jgi:hypothetical protein
LPGADRPDGLVRDHEARVAGRGERDRLGLDLEHELGVARLALLERLADAGDHAEARGERGPGRRATVSSVSPNSCRRSECPTSVPRTPSSASISGEISPVYAPDGSQWAFCA